MHRQHNSVLKQQILSFAVLTVIVTFLPHRTLSLPKHHQIDSQDYAEEDPAIAVEILKSLHQVQNAPAAVSDFPVITKRARGRHEAVPENPCCPVDKEIVEPEFGRNREGELVKLYQGTKARQRFYEISCAPSVADRHCKYLAPKFQQHSQCVQQYSYTYALVRDMNPEDCDFKGCPLKLDYILIRSGCSCQVAVNEDYEPDV